MMMDVVVVCCPDNVDRCCDCNDGDAMGMGKELMAMVVDDDGNG